MLRLKGMILLIGIVLVLFAVPTVAADVVINEIFPHPNPGNNNHWGEWIELYNNGTPVNLNGWNISDGEGTYTIDKDVIISGGGFIILAYNKTFFKEIWGSPAEIVKYGEDAPGLQLADSNDSLTLYDNLSAIIDTSSWTSDPGVNKSIGRCPNGGVSKKILTTATPGTSNNDVCPPPCGDGNCSADESCANCSTDCGKCNGEFCSLNGDCASSHCVHGICRATDPYCGDSYCDTGENCPSDNASCTDNKCYEPTCVNGCGQTAVALNGTDEACTSTSGCGSPPCKCDGSGNCTSVAPTYYCGDGNCSTNENCSCSDCEGKQNGCTSSQLCCSGSCTDLCSSDSGCPSEKTCLNPGTCNASCVNASTVVCDLILSILAEDVFNVSITQNYYLYVNDTIGNYTGSALVGYWIEDSEGDYIKYHSPYNTTINVNENKSREYTPLAVCGNRTYYIKAKIEDTKCNDLDLTNNAATKLITLWGLDPNSIECFKNLTYSLEIPVEVKAEERFAIKIEISNNQNVSQSIEVWSYIYRGTKCYSCYDNETQESNKQVINISAKSSAIVELQNKVNATNGTYYIKVKILKEGFSTPEELTYTIDVKEKEKIEINETVEVIETNETEENVTGEVIYKSKSEKVKKIAMYLLPSLLLAIAVYFAIAKRKQIGEFFITKKQEFEKRRRWKEYIQKRRPGVIKRLSKGFLKPGEKV